MYVFSPELLREVRVRKGLSREALAIASGSSYSAICLAENGYRVPKRAMLIAYADALGVSPRDLVVEDPAFQAVAR
jgi:transcriptional regulator with XRE-family HTH domain